MAYGFFSKRESFRDRSGSLPKEGKFAVKIKKAVTLVMLQLPPPAREPTTRIHAPSQPLMQSPLSRNQTPATPRRARRFFRVRPLTRSPRLADHSAYFGSANLFSCQPFRPSTKVRLRPIAFWVNARMLCSEVEKPTLLLKTRQLTPGFTAESPGAPSSPVLHVAVIDFVAATYDQTSPSVVPAELALREISSRDKTLENHLPRRIRRSLRLGGKAF
jgi:hypothetical protein